MLGLFGEDDEKDEEEIPLEDGQSQSSVATCTTVVEDYHLDNAGDYMRLVSSGMTKDWKPEDHPHVSRKKGDEFELFYGVQNDPNYKKFKDGDGMSGFFSGLGRTRQKRVGQSLASRTKRVSGLGMFANLSCSEDCDCPCNKKKSMSGLGCGDTPCAACDAKKNATMSGFGALPAGDLGPNYGSWPPGPRPEPYRWTANDGATYTLVLIDGKWMYQSSRDKRVFITTSNLYAMMGVKTDPITMIVKGDIPGEPHHDDHQHEINQGWSTVQIAGIGAGWVVLGGIGAYMAYNWYKKRGR